MKIRRPPATIRGSSPTAGGLPVPAAVGRCGELVDPPVPGRCPGDPGVPPHRGHEQVQHHDQGPTGDRVRWVQRRLGIPQNGAFDAATERALRAFQNSKGIDADGVVDPRTFAYLGWSTPKSV